MFVIFTFQKFVSVLKERFHTVVTRLICNGHVPLGRMEFFVFSVTFPCKFGGSGLKQATIVALHVHSGSPFTVIRFDAALFVRVAL